MFDSTFLGFKPKLRRLAIERFREGDDEYFQFHDKAGIAPDVALNAMLGPLLTLMDGSRNLDAIWTLAKERDPDVPLSWLQELVANLDSNYLLDSPGFEARRLEVESEFLNAPVRPTAFAGLSYSEDPAKLREFLGRKLAQGTARLPQRAYEAQAVEGVVTPHIDFTRGGHTEAASYAPLCENVRATGQAFDTLVVFGIAHQGVEYPFCLAPKGYDTPLGLVSCDLDFACDLEARLGPQLTREQNAHAQEHSVEFSAVFMRFFDELKTTKIVPILCGGFWESLRNGQAPEAAEPEVRDFIEALRAVTEAHQAQGKKIGFVASVDGAHVGTQFGDSSRLTAPRLQAIGRADRQWCAAIEAGDRAALHQHFAKDGNRFNVTRTQRFTPCWRLSRRGAANYSTTTRPITSAPTSSSPSPRSRFLRFEWSATHTKSGSISRDAASSRISSSEGAV